MLRALYWACGVLRISSGSILCNTLHGNFQVTEFSHHHISPHLTTSLTSYIIHLTHIIYIIHITHISHHTSLTSLTSHITHISHRASHTSDTSHVSDTTRISPHHSHLISHHTSHLFFLAGATCGDVGVSLVLAGDHLVMLQSYFLWRMQLDCHFSRRAHRLVKFGYVA